MFSKACEYGLRATIYLAQKSSAEKKLGVEEIAGAIDAPRSFAAKILQQLNREGVIQSTKGPHGGFYLPDNLRSQPVWNVLVAFAEDQRLTNCVMGLHLCNDKKPCPLHQQYKVIKQQLLEMFKEKTISDLAGSANQYRFFIKHQ